MNLLKSNILLLLVLVCSVFTISGQDVIQENQFSYAPIFNNQVVLIREIALNNNSTVVNYQKLKEWAKINYGSDIFASSVKLDKKNNEAMIKSKIELLLPPNSEGVDDKIIMNYRLNIFIIKNKCVFEIKNVTYNYKNTSDGLVKKNFEAIDIISENALAQTDKWQELRIATQKATFQYFNTLADDLASRLN